MLDWIHQFLDTILSVVPRIIKIRATHRGVVWRFCGQPQELKPGISWIWPIFDEWEIIVTARQTDDLPPQSLTLRDGVPVAVAGVVVYRIDDAVAACGSVNWDITSTLRDISMAAIANIISNLLYEDCEQLETINEMITNEVVALAAEYGVAVESCCLVELAVARTVRHLGIQFISQ